MTPFYEAAIRFAEGTNDWAGCCNEIDYALVKNGYAFSKERDFFNILFRPTLEERNELNLYLIHWMGSIHNTPDQNRNDRVIALLFADLLWKEINP